MVCAKCQSRMGTTHLATPGVKRKNELHLTSGSGIGNARSGRTGSNGTSSASTSAAASATIGKTGISKSKLLSNKPKAVYAALTQKCTKCTSKTEGGKILCHRCAYKDNACAMCGKSGNKTGKGKGGVPVVLGQRFSAK